MKQVPINIYRERENDSIKYIYIYIYIALWGGAWQSYDHRVHRFHNNYPANHSVIITQTIKNKSPIVISQIAFGVKLDWVGLIGLGWIWVGYNYIYIYKYIYMYIHIYMMANHDAIDASERTSTSRLLADQPRVQVDQQLEQQPDIEDITAMF